MSRRRHLRGLFQFQPGLTDNPLCVLQLRLELAVFSGDLLKQLQTHRNRLVCAVAVKRLQRRHEGIPDGTKRRRLGTFLKSLASPPGVQSLHELSDLSA